MKKIQNFLNKWNSDGIKKSLDRKKQRKLNAQREKNKAEGYSPADLIDTKFENCRALKTFTAPNRAAGRINLITDSINEGSLYGGVGTAIILAGLLSGKKNSDLRIITRTERAVSANVKKILDLYKINIQNNVEFAHAPTHGEYHPIDVTPQDIFITTSWWSTASTIPSVPEQSIYYLLQEDERMFYAYGDERLQCESILNNSNIKFIINTQLLYDHLISDGIESVRKSGQWFEPAFPSEIYFPRRVKNQKKKLFFYARPNNQRNLFLFGINVIDEAIRKNIISPEKWELILVGKNIPNIKFHENLATQRIENLSWQEYSELIGGVDLGLSLMYTPHPSYPPLDLAASGTPVITNRFQNKIDLKKYSENIICSELNLSEMLGALEKGIALCQNEQEVLSNHQKSGLIRSWELSFADVISSIKI